jgi:hypothetical protein
LSYQEQVWPSLQRPPVRWGPSLAAATSQRILQIQNCEIHTISNIYANHSPPLNNKSRLLCQPSGVLCGVRSKANCKMGLSNLFSLPPRVRTLLLKPYPLPLKSL